MARHNPSRPAKPAASSRSTRKGDTPQAPDAVTDDATKKRALEEAFTKRWMGRLTSANKRYDEWEKKFKCSTLEDYWEGHQWDGLADNERKTKYTINLMFATVETQLPALMFSTPKVNAEPRPGTGGRLSESASEQASLIEDTLQTFVDEPNVHFDEETNLALRDVYSRFGIVEVGYTADFIDNPNAGKPIQKGTSGENEKDAAGEELKEPRKLPREGTESVYVRHLDPATFRVSPGRNILSQNDWCGYYEWQYLADVKRNQDYSHTDDLKATGSQKDSLDPIDGADQAPEDGMVKIWKIFDLRAKRRHVFADGHKLPLQKNKKYAFVPFEVLKFYERRNNFYPLPPLFNWLSPQDELNETREMQRVHRRRFKRRYMRLPSVKSSEFEKLEDGPDGVCIEVGALDAIRPIEDAQLSDTQNNLSNSREDFMEISGVSGEARGVPQSDTATQANIINTRAQLREANARSKVAKWLAAINRLMLLSIKEYMTHPVQVRRSVNPWDLAKQAKAGQPPDDLTRTMQTWQQLDVESIEDVDVDIKVEISSLSPVTKDLERASWMAAVAILTNPQILSLMMIGNPADPTEPSAMLRQTLAVHNITNERQVREIWRVGTEYVKQQALLAQASAVAAGGAPMGPPGPQTLQPGGGGKGSPSAPRPAAVAPGTPSGDGAPSGPVM